MTQEEATAAQALQHVRYLPASWDKRFARSLSGSRPITEKEAPHIWRMFKRYRRQIRCPNKDELLKIAYEKSAPDLRKQSILDAQQREIERLKAESKQTSQTVNNTSEVWEKQLELAGVTAP